MEFNNKVVRVEIFREEEQVSLIFNELRELKINLSDSSVEDIKNLFNSIFDTIVDEKELISLELKDEKNDLFHEVAEDIIDQLNSEIEQSKSDLIKIIDLNFRTNA
mgnify:CR=1 FL=1